MKLLPVIVMGVAVTATAATRMDDGSVLLTAEDVSKVEQYLREIQAEAIINRDRVKELEAQVKVIRNAKCS